MLPPHGSSYSSRTTKKMAHYVSDLCALCFASRIEDPFNHQMFRDVVTSFVTSPSSALNSKSVKDDLFARICLARWQVLERPIGIKTHGRRRVRPYPSKNRVRPSARYGARRQFQAVSLSLKPRLVAKAIGLLYRMLPQGRPPTIYDAFISP